MNKQYSTFKNQLFKSNKGGCFSNPLRDPPSNVDVKGIKRKNVATIGWTEFVNAGSLSKDSLRVRSKTARDGR